MLSKLRFALAHVDLFRQTRFGFCGGILNQSPAAGVASSFLRVLHRRHVARFSRGNILATAGNRCRRNPEENLVLLINF